MAKMTEEELEAMHTLTSGDVVKSIELHLSLRDDRYVELDNDCNFTTTIESAKTRNDQLTLTLSNGQVYLITAILVADDASKRKEEKDEFAKYVYEEDYSFGADRDEWKHEAEKAMRLKR